MSEQYQIPVPPWLGITQDEVSRELTQRLIQSGPDHMEAIEWAMSTLQAPMIELLLADMVPDDLLPGLLPHAWAFSTHYPSAYADMDTYVALFRRAGFVTDFLEVIPPKSPLTIYRGVPHARDEGTRAIAWTSDLNVARYFAHRLDHLADPEIFGEDVRQVEPTIWKATVPPEGVLALFYGQNEIEVVVDPGSLQNAEVFERSQPGEDPLNLSPDKKKRAAVAIAALRDAFGGKR